MFRRDPNHPYDSLGRPTGLSLDDGYEMTYAYDSVGRMGSVGWSGAGGAYTAAYAYVENSDMVSGYDIVVGGTNTLQTRKTFESDRNLITGVSNLWNSTLISSFDYVNDAVGRRTERLDVFASAPTAVTTNDFGYNDRSELVSADMGTNSYGYVYDPIGNRTSATNSAEVLTYLANELNQYTNIADGVTNSPTYDADGNMLTYGGWTFTWNGENRLVIASNSTTVIESKYDYMGRRFQKVVNGVTNSFLYDGWAMIREERSGETNSYVYGLDLSGSLQGAGTIGGLLSADLNGTSVFYCYDANGNVTDLVDTNGASGAHYEYGPFGGIVSQTGSQSTNNLFRFSSKYTDDETDLLYYGLRYYSPGLGRWPNRDPLGEIDGGGIYAFIRNYTPNAVDGLGLSLRATTSNDRTGCCDSDVNSILEDLENTADDRLRRLLSGNHELNGRKCLVEIDCGQGSECPRSRHGPKPCPRCAPIGVYRPPGEGLLGKTSGRISICGKPSRELLIHELQHAYQHCAGADCSRGQATPKSCRDRLCQEMQAALCEQRNTGKACDPRKGKRFSKKQCAIAVAKSLADVGIHSECPDCNQYWRTGPGLSIEPDVGGCSLDEIDCVTYEPVFPDS